MERIIFKEINGKKYPMAMTLAALEYINREKGGIQGYGEMLGGLENITAILDVSLVLIRQGIAKYKFERGDVVDEDICLEAPSREELELTLDLDDITDLSNTIVDCLKVSRKNAIAGKPAKGSKKNQA